MSTTQRVPRIVVTSKFIDQPERNMCRADAIYGDKSVTVSIHNSTMAQWFGQVEAGWDNGVLYANYSNKQVGEIAAAVEYVYPYETITDRQDLQLLPHTPASPNVLRALGLIAE